MLVTIGNNLAGLNNNNKKNQLTYISRCYGLNHCPFIPPHTHTSYVEALHLQCNSIWGEAFGRKLGHESRAHMMGLVPL